MHILRLPDVVARTGISRSMIYRLMAAGQFPAAVRITGRVTGWRSTDVDEWIASLPAVEPRRAQDAAHD